MDAGKQNASVVGFLLGLGLNIVALVILVPALATAGGEKVTVGGTEVVTLLPWGVKVPARIDTGAARTSLEARDLKVENKLARFKLRGELGGLELTLPVIAWRAYKNPGARDRRPVVEIEFCFGAKRIRTEANLRERSHLEFPMLVGRDVLEGSFVVDVSRLNALPPSCDAEGS